MCTTQSSQREGCDRCKLHAKCSNKNWAILKVGSDFYNCEFNFNRQNLNANIVEWHIAVDYVETNGRIGEPC